MGFKHTYYSLTAVGFGWDHKVVNVDPPGQVGHHGPRRGPQTRGVSPLAGLGSCARSSGRRGKLGLPAAVEQALRSGERRAPDYGNMAGREAQGVHKVGHSPGETDRATRTRRDPLRRAKSHPSQPLLSWPPVGRSQFPEKLFYVYGLPKGQSAHPSYVRLTR